MSIIVTPQILHPDDPERDIPPPLIFLDIDGVMNSAASGFKFRTSHRADPNAVDALNAILVAVPESRIVISSTWREIHSLDYIAGWLEGQGVKPGRILDKTGVFRCENHLRDRGLEINAFLAKWPKPPPFVILDDDAWDFSPHQSHFVQTDQETGLTTKDATRAICLFISDPGRG